MVNRLMVALALALVVFVGAVQQVSAATTATTSCSDDPDYRHWSDSSKDCAWVAATSKCDWTHQGIPLGVKYCPFSCDSCPEEEIIMEVRSAPVGGEEVDEDTISLEEKSCYAAGESLKISFTNMNPLLNDWIGIYTKEDAVDVSQSDYAAWKYVCGDRDTPCDSPSSGTITLGSLLRAGTYVAFLFSNDGYTVIKATPEFTIAATCDGDDGGGGTSPSSSTITSHPTKSPVMYGSPSSSTITSHPTKSPVMYGDKPATYPIHTTPKPTYGDSPVMYTPALPSSSHPTKGPTAKPAEPTVPAAPTGSPTSGPTAGPTSGPTASPTGTPCTIEICAVVGEDEIVITFDDCDDSSSQPLLLLIVQGGGSSVDEKGIKEKKIVYEEEEPDTSDPIIVKLEDWTKDPKDDEEYTVYLVREDGGPPYEPAEASDSFELGDLVECTTKSDKK